MEQKDHDNKMGSTHGMYGTWSANLEVERTIKKAELTAFLCLLTRIVGPTTAHVGNKRIIDGKIEKDGEMRSWESTIWQEHGCEWRGFGMV